MRVFQPLCVIILLSSCNNSNEFQPRTLPLSEEKFLWAVDSLLTRNPQYRVPSRWVIYDSYSQRNGDKKSHLQFYFPPPDEELYYLIVENRDEETVIKITAIHNGTEWLREDQLPESEIIRIQNKFDKRIFRKLELLTAKVRKY